MAKTQPKTSKLYVAAYDIHWPYSHHPTLDAMMDFIKKNRVDGFVFGGDVFDNDHVSHHNRGKIAIEASGSISADTISFDEGLLRPLEAVLPKHCHKVWIEGNHDFWLNEYLEQHPQMTGSIERKKTLDLKARGWKHYECGEIVRVGKLNFIHGETLNGQYHAKTAVDRYCSNVVYGHFHTIQSAIKVLPHDANQRWAAWSMPAMCQLNPTYLRNKPTCWVNGFGIIEFFEGGHFNVSQIVVDKGRFSYGGRIYRG
jgi:hypothetical protein